VIDKLDRSRESFLDAVVKGAFTVPGDGSLDFVAIVRRLASYGYEGWFVVEAEQDPKANPPLEMAVRRVLSASVIRRRANMTGRTQCHRPLWHPDNRVIDVPGRSAKDRHALAARHRGRTPRYSADGRP
jgi:hypothetical protein